MRKIVLLGIITFISLFSQAQTKSIFSNLSNKDGISYVCISKTMLNLFGSDLGKEVSGKLRLGDFGEFSNNLNQIEIVSSSTSKSALQLRRITKTFTPQNGYKEFMKIKDKNDDVAFYFKKGSPDNLFILVDDEGNEEVNVIVLTGNINLKEISKLTRGSRKK